MKAEWTNRDSLSIDTTGQNSKAILVIDMPENCGKCRLVDYGKCRGSKSYIPLSSYNRSKECPLRPLPKWKNEYTDIDAMGWNACLDEITGETE